MLMLRLGSPRPAWQHTHTEVRSEWDPQNTRDRGWGKQLAGGEAGRGSPVSDISRRGLLYGRKSPPPPLQRVSSSFLGRGAHQPQPPRGNRSQKHSGFTGFVRSFWRRRGPLLGDWSLDLGYRNRCHSDGTLEEVDSVWFCLGKQTHDA